MEMFPNSDKLLRGIYWQNHTQNHTDGITYMGNKRAISLEYTNDNKTTKVKSCFPIRIILQTCCMLFLVCQ